MLFTIIIVILSTIADSDVDLIDVGSGAGRSEQGSTQPRGIVNSHQPIVHFEASASVRARSPSYDYDVDLLPKELETRKM